MDMGWKQSNMPLSTPISDWSQSSVVWIWVGRGEVTLFFRNKLGRNPLSYGYGLEDRSRLFQNPPASRNPLSYGYGLEVTQVTFDLTEVEVAILCRMDMGWKFLPDFQGQEDAQSQSSVVWIWVGRQE